MDDINQIIANLTPQDMEMLRGVAASILGDGGQGSAPGAASLPVHSLRLSLSRGAPTAPCSS